MLSFALALALSATPIPNPTLDPQWVDDLERIAKAYPRYGRVDESPNLAPELCRIPYWPHDYGQASEVRQSAAGPHGKKLYYLWAKDRWAYLGLGQKQAQPIEPGFSIVKESFHAMPRDPKAPTPVEVKEDFVTRMPAPFTSLTVGDTTFDRGEPAGLYLMMKVGPKRDGTDDGWVYGTITTDGTVTSAGRVASCMGCHEQAPHDRLFGLAVGSRTPEERTRQTMPPGAPRSPSFRLR